MNESDIDRTRSTLLVRLREAPADPFAWQEFVQRYQPRIYSFCLSWPLQPADAEDVTQAVLLRLVTRMRDFRYDRTQSFRAWLQTVTRNVLINFLNERREQGSGDSDVIRFLDNVEGREELVRRLEEEFNQELLEQAFQRVQARVSEQRWNAFRLTALEGRSGAEVGEQLGMTIATVFSTKSKIQKLVREEVARLEALVDGKTQEGQ